MPCLTQTLSLLRTTGNALLRDAVPPICLLCQRQHGALRWLCDDCQAEVIRNDHPCQRCGLPDASPECPDCQRAPPAFAGTLAPLRYSEALRGLLHRWKFAGQSHLTSTLAALAGDAWQAHPPVDAIVPLPCHWRRRWSRGFDQTWLLANAVRHAGEITAPVKPWLHRRHATQRQHRLKARARRSNVQGAFRASRQCQGQHLLLLDDIMTTGATMASATETLLHAGASSVHLCCLARVEDHSDAI